MCKITVIIPSTGEISRFESLKRAISSIYQSSSNEVRIIVVVNGNRFSQVVLDWLGNQKSLDFVYEKIGSSPNAQLIGRRLVRSEFFCFLDDDDEFINNALDIRLKEMEYDDGVALVLTNGYKRSGEKLSTCYDNLERLINDPLLGVLRGNWLASCNHLMRTKHVEIDFFDDYHDYFEWTWLAFKISKAKLKIKSIDEATFIYNSTQNSLSKSDEYNKSFISLSKKMIKNCSEKNHKSIIKNKLASHYHKESEKKLNNNIINEAVTLHLKCLSTGDGLKYLSYTRHILTHAVKNIFKQM